MTKKYKLTHERLKEVLDYNETSGVFVWKKSLSKNISIGAIAGRQTNGHTYIGIDGVSYLAQRLAWLYVNGVWPTWSLRFKNGNRNDVSLTNLYEYHSIDVRCVRGDSVSKSAYEKAWREAFPNQMRNKYLQRDFGITLAEYTEKHAKQNGLCAICGQAETETRNGKVKALAVDHDHSSDEIRDLLCSVCNKALGLFRDNIQILDNAIAYLNKHSDKNTMAWPIEPRLLKDFELCH